jgi:hypothetical protein
MILPISEGSIDINSVELALPPYLLPGGVLLIWKGKRALLASA